MKLEGISDKEILNYYSVDSSFYQIKPKLLVVPKNLSDVIKCVKFANKNKISVTVRGGGTGLVGSALGSGIILDLKNLDKIKISKNHVTAQPGIKKGKLDQILAKHNKFFGPNPSVGPYCTIGGMIGTNASGMHSLKYGSTIDNLLQVTIVTGRGKLVTLPSRSKLAQSIVQISKNIGKYPNVSKNSCGYRLDTAKSLENTHKIIAGSEGTLGIVVSAKLQIQSIPKRKTLIVLGYSSPKNALHDCHMIIQLKPSAVEFIDNYTMKNFRQKFPKNTKCLLFVEFDSNITRSITNLKSISSGKLLYKIENQSIAKWWAYRNSALHYSLKNLLAGQTTSHIIEDATLPVEKLEQIIPIVSGLKKKFGAKFVMYGHAGNGNLHIRVSVSRNKNIVNSLAKEFFEQIIRLGGTITGEHGDGIARTKFVKMQYGPKTYSAFLRLKQQFDPNHTLNPGKIVSRGTRQILA